MFAVALGKGRRRAGQGDYGAKGEKNGLPCLFLLVVSGVFARSNPHTNQSPLSVAGALDLFGGRQRMLMQIIRM